MNFTDNDTSQPHFHAADYVCFGFTLLISSGIGVYYACTGGKQKTTSEYLMANRNMGILPISLSLLASFNSAIGLLGIPSEVYAYGIYHFFTIFGKIVMCPFVAYGYLPVFYNLKLTSVYEYLERRFNRSIRLCGSVIFILHMTTYVSFVVYAPSLALAQVTGFKLWNSIAAISIVGTIYTVIGGIKAVMWTDVFQAVVMFIAIIVIISKGIVDVGGISKMIDENIEGERLAMISLSFDPTIRYTIFGTFIYGFVFWSSVYATNQTQVQRCLTSPSLKKAQTTIWLNMPGLFFTESLLIILGLIVYSAYNYCDPSLTNQIKKPDQILPLFVMNSFQKFPGVAGIFVAGVFCGSLSTLSSVLNSLATVTLYDFILGFNRWKNMREETAAKVSKLLAFSYGIICVAFILIIQNLGGLVQGITLNSSMFSGITFGLFTLAMFNPKASSLNAFIGILCGMIVGLWVIVGKQASGYVPPRPPISTEQCPLQIYHNIYNQTFNESLITSTRNEDVFVIYKISYLLSVVIPFVSVLVFGSIASFIVGRKSVVEDELVSPIAVYFMKKLCKKKKQNSGHSDDENNLQNLTNNGDCKEKSPSENKV